MSNQTAVSALIALGRKADEAEAAAVVVQAEGDGNLGAFRAAVAVALAPLKKAAREEVLVALKDAGVRSVPGVSTNVATTYQLIGQFLVAHPEEPAVLSGAEFEKSYTKIKAATLMTYETAWRLDKGADVRTEISAVKAYATEMSYEVLDHAMQMYGAMGMTKELPLALMQAQMRTMRIYDGPTEVHKWVVARNLLGLKR